MAPIRGCQTKILIDEFDLSGESNNVVLDMTVPALDYVTFQECYQQRTPGLPMASIAHNGYFFGHDAGHLEYELYARMGAANDVTVGVILGTSLTVPVAYILPTSFGQQLRLDAPVDNLLAIQGNWVGGSNNQLRRGLQVAFGEAIDATGALTGVDFASAGAAGGQVFVFVQGITGTATDAEIIIQSDSDSGFGTAATEATIEFSAVGAYSATMSGSIGRYIRANVTDLGGADDITFLIVVCVTGVTD